MIFALGLLLLGLEPPGYDQAVVIRRSGDLAAAARAFESVADEAADPAERQKARSAAAALYWHDFGCPEEARRLYDRVLTQAIDDGPGVRAALSARIELARIDGGPRNALRLLRRIYHQHPYAGYAPLVLLRAAHLLGDDLEAPAAARVPLARLLAYFPRSRLNDEAQFYDARLLRKLGRGLEALSVYRRMIAGRRDALVVGDYNSELLDDAYFGLAETLENLNRREQALDAYLDLVAELEDSRLVDDALFRAEQLARQDGDAARARALHDELRVRRPDSRFLDRSSAR